MSVDSFTINNKPLFPMKKIDFFYLLFCSKATFNIIISTSKIKDRLIQKLKQIRKRITQLTFTLKNKHFHSIF